MEQLYAPWRMEWVTQDNNSRDDGCVFCSMAQDSADQENRIVARSEHAFVLLNHSPYNPGHMLIIPTDHVSEYAALDASVLFNLHRLQQKTMQALLDLYRPDGFKVGMNNGGAGGASITNHLHSHVVPRWESDTTFMPIVSDTAVMEESLDKTYEHLHEAFTDMDGIDSDGLDTAVYMTPDQSVLNHESSGDNR
jgi:ATP adenylyltransferase